jgi:molecular chaperone GrpE
MSDQEEIEKNPDADRAAQSVPPHAEVEAGPATETPGSETTPEQEVQKWREVAVRAAADLDNFRKRMAREVADVRKYANQDILEQLLPIIDNFEFGLAAARDDSGQSTIYTGMSMVQRQLVDFLAENGVDEIATIGLPFDPNVHDAVSKQASADVPEGHVISLTRKGYVLKDRLLRPAAPMVRRGAGRPIRRKPDGIQTRLL